MRIYSRIDTLAVLTVRAEVDRAIGNRATDVVGDPHRQVVAIDERHYQDASIQHHRPQSDGSGDEPSK